MILCKKLVSQSMKTTVIVRENRINSETKTMISQQKLKKLRKGSFDYRCDLQCMSHNETITTLTIFAESKSPTSQYIDANHDYRQSL